MEMRLITTDHERALFSQRVTEARAQFGGGYRGVSRGPIDNEARITAATLIGLFAHLDDGAESMVAGMAIRDGDFPSYPATPVTSRFRLRVRRPLGAQQRGEECSVARRRNLPCVAAGRVLAYQR